MEAILLSSVASFPVLFNSMSSDRCRCAALLRRSPRRQPFPGISADKGQALAAVLLPPAAWPEMGEHEPEVEKYEDLDQPELEKGIRVTVEELEKMEEEAMEGKDEGREPLDYDRRARIFYESSRVFGRVDCGG
ncbi:hypothetical protein KSP39_PZI017646 [Platanthera zijinensis]|uniref:Uncharacterized protein n=1 Tax=Platanthera zijinensis TaxID=2320716 RepID=A0AAP0B6B5_9ASPA